MRSQPWLRATPPITRSTLHAQVVVQQLIFRWLRHGSLHGAVSSSLAASSLASYRHRVQPSCPPLMTSCPPSAAEACPTSNTSVNVAFLSSVNSIKFIYSLAIASSYHSQPGNLRVRGTYRQSSRCFSALSLPGGWICRTPSASLSDTIGYFLFGNTRDAFALKGVLSETENIGKV